MEDRKIKTNSPSAWLLAARPKTLSGAAVPVMIGLSLAFVDSRLYGAGAFNYVAALLCLLFAFVMQVDANFVNDFFDFVRGNDDADTRLGPRRACAQGWITLDAMKRAIALTTCLAIVVGLPLAYYGGLEMVLVGLACLAGCFLYTTHLSYLALGDVMVLLFFGVVPVCCCYYVQLHTLTPLVVIASVACGLVVDALLLVNNYRDRFNDRAVGKQTLVVKIGDRYSRWLYLAVGVVACLMGVTFWLEGHVLAFVLPFIYLVLHLYTYLNISRIDRGKPLNRCLGETARNIFIYGVCVTLGLLV